VISYIAPRVAVDYYSFLSEALGGSEASLEQDLTGAL